MCEQCWSDLKHFLGWIGFTALSFIGYLLANWHPWTGT